MLSNKAILVRIYESLIELKKLDFVILLQSLKSKTQKEIAENATHFRNDTPKYRLPKGKATAMTLIITLQKPF